MTTTELIPFHSDNLVYVEHEGAPYLGIRRACEHLGIDDRVQIRKLKAEPELWGAVIMTAPSAGGEQETFCIPTSRVAAWLFSINANKVADHLRELLLRYKIEAADVLDRHFRQRRDDRAEEVEVLRAMLERSHANLLVAIPQWAKIRILHAADLWSTTAARKLKMSDGAFYSHFEEMQRCGILPAGRWDAGTKDETWYGVMRQLQYENDRLRSRVADAELRAFEAEQQALPTAEPADEEEASKSQTVISTDEPEPGPDAEPEAREDDGEASR